jgi:hypothetical protein
MPTDEGGRARGPAESPLLFPWAGILLLLFLWPLLREPALSLEQTFFFYFAAWALAIVSLVLVSRSQERLERRGGSGA